MLRLCYVSISPPNFVSLSPNLEIHIFKEIFLAHFSKQFLSETFTYYILSPRKHVCERRSQKSLILIVLWLSLFLRDFCMCLILRVFWDGIVLGHRPSLTEFATATKIENPQKLWFYYNPYFQGIFWKWLVQGFPELVPC